MSTVELRSVPSVTREEMIRRGAYGFLGRAYECEIPLSQIIPVTTDPACEMWGAYPLADAGQPVETKYSREENGYLLFAGTQRVKEAEARGDQYMPAFVEADNGEIGAFAILQRSHIESRR
jgi:hypothetical protein